MKQQQADAGQDLDAGWDDVVTDVAASAAQSSAGENQATIDNLDAGWELDVERTLGDPKPLKDMGAKGRNRAKSQRQATAPIAAPVQTLSKKARREIERQNRMHAEKRKSEAKLQRKEQRRAGRRENLRTAAHETPAAVLASAKVKQTTNVKQPSPSKPKPQANQPHREAAEPATNGTQVNKAEAHSRWPWLALVVIAIILVAVKWFFF